MRSLSVFSGRIHKQIQISGSYQEFKDSTKCNSVKRQTTRVKVGGNALARKKGAAHTLYSGSHAKGGKNQWASFLRV